MPTSPAPSLPSGESTDDDKPEGRVAAVDLAAEPGRDARHQERPVGPRTAMLASEWFLDDTALDEESVASAIVPMNTAPAGKPERVVDFTVQVMDRERIAEIRRECTKRRGDGTEEVDGTEANLRIATEALLDPPIRTDPRFLVVRGQRFMDPSDALQARFAHKPGLIDQLATKITEVGGYDTGDVKEVKAAGNS